MKVYYNPKLKAKARKLRKNMTWAEVILWNRLKRKQLGYRFNRQKPILNYIVDFYCFELRLVIEIDGSSHDERKYDYDVKRQREIEALGFNFLRFAEFEVRSRTDDVVQGIGNYIEEFSKNPSFRSIGTGSGGWSGKA